MRKSTKFQFPMAVLGAAALLAGCGSSSKSSSGASTASSSPGASASGGESAGDGVRAASNPKLGSTILVDEHGMTLYSLSAESAGRFICASASCLQAWHPLAAQSGGAPRSSVASLGVTRRPDGTEQVTYKGMPLYTFALDRAPGSVSGQGIKDVGTWQAVSVSAGTSAAPASTTPTTPTTKSEGGHTYGY